MPRVSYGSSYKMQDEFKLAEVYPELNKEIVALGITGDLRLTVTSDVMGTQFYPHTNMHLGHAFTLGRPWTKGALEAYYQRKYTDEEFAAKMTGTMCNESLASWGLVEFRGCCGTCISHHGNVYGMFQHKGLGTILNNFRIELARAAGYGLLICTDKDINERERKILAKNGWKDALQFTNPRTGNLINVSYHIL